ncbi:MAG: ABC transporter substrate-binding protein [Clostridium sp.]|uniref:ABC transporter substrate-binding protein n=1 Tax=Clostridium sp. TaxID=1506 RepID=UPI003F2C5690
MSKKKIAKIIGGIVVVAIIAGGIYAVVSSKDSNANKPLVLSLSSTPPTMNPLYANSSSSLMVTDVLYEPLYTLGDKGQIVYNGLAEKVTHSEDCKTYTVTLKKNLKWSDGQPLTANDVVFTFNKIMNPKNNAVIMQTFMVGNKPVTIKKINDDTVQFDLPAPSLGFVGNLSQLYPIPEHIYKEVPDIKTAEANKKPVGDGPYMFQSEEPGSTVTLVKNPNFFGNEAKIDKVVFRVIPDKNAGVAALESNQLSAGFGSNQILQNEKIQKNYNVKETSSGLVNTVIFNFENKDLQNIKVREAITYALNKEALTKAEYGDSQYVQEANSVFAPGTQYYTNDVKQYSQDVDKAKALMKESGAKNVTLRLAYAAGFQWAQNQAVLIKDELAQIGITVELEPVELNAFFKEIFTPNNKNYDLAINGYNMGTTPDGYSTLFTTGGANNASNFSNPEIDKLFKEAQTANTETERANIYKQIQKQISEDLPLYVINYPEDIILTSKDLKGVEQAGIQPIAMFNNLGELYWN